MTNTVQGWTRVGKGLWTRIDDMCGDANRLAATLAAAQQAARGDQQIQLFSAGYNPNR